MDQTNPEISKLPNKPKGPRLITNGHPERRAPFKRFLPVGVLLLCVGLFTAYAGFRWKAHNADGLVRVWMVMILGNVMILGGTLSLIGWWVMGDIVFEYTD